MSVVPPPQPMLQVKETYVDKPRYPVIDVHNHLDGEFGGNWGPDETLGDLLDQAGVAGLVDLDGGWGEHILEDHLDRFKSRYPARIKVFGGVDWSRWPEKGDRFGEWAASRLQAQADKGAEGVKVWKPLGLSVVDQHEELVAVDDPRLEPIWATAGELGLPVLIHVADPLAFFKPLDDTNERRAQLEAHPEWHFPSPPYPSFLEIVEAMARMVKSHPNTTFIGAHVGCYPENLDWVDVLLDHAPNFHVDIAARIAELGRQPNRARRFLADRSDRVLFGLDLGPDVASYRLAYRFLETHDDYFEHSVDGDRLNGDWRISGLSLSDDVLGRIYNDNASRLLGWNPTTMEVPA